MLQCVASSSLNTVPAHSFLGRSQSLKAGLAGRISTRASKPTATAAPLSADRFVKQPAVPVPIPPTPEALELELEVPLLDTESATVVFQVSQPLAFGEVLKVVGNAPALGKWNATAAPAMTWAEGDIWTLKVAVPAGWVGFKWVVYNTISSEARWESGEDRWFEVYRDGSAEVFGEDLANWL